MVVTGGFPRVRGDVPGPNQWCGKMVVVFPACAGMFRHDIRAVQELLGFPRVRGDVPIRAAARRANL